MKQALESSGYPLTVSVSGSLDELLGHDPDVIVADYSESLYAEVQSATALVIVGIPREESIHLNGPRGWATLGAEFADEALLGAVLTSYAGLVTRERSQVDNFAEPERAAVAEPLTDREKQILQLMAEGQANKQIAARLGITIHTVKFHIASLLVKLGASSRTEAVTLGIRQGLVVL